MKSAGWTDERRLPPRREGMPTEAMMIEEISPELFDQIRPNKLVDLVVRLDFAREEADVRRTVILDQARPLYVILSQTDPPLTSALVNRTIEVTFLHTVAGEHRARRFGFSALLVKLLPQYRLAGGYSDQAMVITYPKRFRETALRMHYRLEPSLTLDLDLQLPDEAVTLSLVDISLGGARLSVPGWVSWPRGRLLRVLLSIEGMMYELEARVVRTIQSTSRRFVHVGIRFEGVNPPLRLQLNRVIQANSREQLRQRAGLSENEV